jgi:hypothetical protein
MNLMDHLDHVFHDFRSRGNGVGSHEPGTGGNGAEGRCFIAQEVQLVFLRRCCQTSQFHAVHGSDGCIIAFLENLLVFGNNFFALLAKTLGNETVEWIFREPENTGAHAEGRNVLHLQAAVLLCQFRNRKGQYDTTAVGFKLRMECIIGNDDASFRHFFTMEINGLLVQGHQTVHMLPDSSYFLRCNTKGNGRMAAFDTRSKKTLAEKGIPFLCQDTAQDFAAGLYALPLLAAHFPYKITFCFHFICLLGDE